MGESFEAYRSSQENFSSREALPPRPETPEEQAERKKKDQRRLALERQAHEAGNRESEASTQNFEREHPDIFNLKEESAIETFTAQKQLRDFAENTQKESEQNEQSLFEGTALDVETGLETQAKSREFLKVFAEEFFVLFEQYRARLPQGASLVVNDSLLKNLTPENPALRQAVKETLTGKEMVSFKEILAIVIIKDIILRRGREINDDIQKIHEPEGENPRNLREEQHIVLLALGIRKPIPEESGKEAQPLSFADFLELNRELNTLEKPEERTALLDRFILAMSRTLHISPEVYRGELQKIMEQIEGLETLKSTFERLAKDGKLAEIVNDDGTLHLERFTRSYEAATQEVSMRFQVIKTSKPPEGSQTIRQYRAFIQEIPLDEARNSPLLARLSQENPFLAEHFFRGAGAIHLMEAPDGQRTLNLELDRTNTEHGLSLRIDLTTRKSAVYLAGIKALDTSLDHPLELHRDLNTASANHLLLEEANLPQTCFIPEPVDKGELKERNDPLQLIKDILGAKQFPESAVLNVTPKLIQTVRHVLWLTLGERYKDASPGEVKRLLQKRGWLDAYGRLLPEANRFLGGVYELTKLRPDIDQHEELLQVLRESRNLQVKEAWEALKRKGIVIFSSII